jgi:hypothetical protein
MTVVFREEARLEPERSRLLMWAELGDEPIRCRATFSFIEELFDISGGSDEISQRLDEIEAALRPLFKEKIVRGDFEMDAVKTVLLD